MTGYRIAQNVPVFYHVTKWGAPGQVIEQVKLRAGDRIEVDGTEADRLLAAGAIVPADHTSPAPVVSESGPSPADEDAAASADDGGRPRRPRHTAPVAEWRRYAVARGDFTAAEADGLTKAELIEVLS